MSRHKAKHTKKEKKKQEKGRGKKKTQVNKHNEEKNGVQGLCVCVVVLEVFPSSFSLVVLFVESEVNEIFGATEKSVGSVAQSKETAKQSVGSYWIGRGAILDKLRL